MNVRAPNRLNIARLPTPIVKLERISAAGGPALWVKRDDQTGGVLTGNKIRKLQYAVREALDQGADTLVTCGGLQSNHCRATAVLARQVGLDVTLLLRGAPPPRAEGNYLLDRVLGAEIKFVSAEVYADKANAMAGIAAGLREQGRKPYVIAEGCSMPIGSFGYIEACEEIAAAETSLGVRFDAIVHAVGSGGTSAGLELGTRLWGLSAKVWGIPVCDSAAHFRPLIANLARQTAESFDLDVHVDAQDIGLIDGYVGLGYGQARPEELESLVHVARREGLIFDPVYAGKAFYGLQQELSGRFAGLDNILFVHTGGVFGLFPHAEGLRRHIDFAK